MATSVEVLDLQKLLSKKDKEIKFLRETVRVECEERMGLVASVSQLQKQVPLDRVSGHGSSTSHSAGELESQVEPKVDHNFMRLFQKANQKNSKRLSKQSRSSLSNY